MSSAEPGAAIEACRRAIERLLEKREAAAAATPPHHINAIFGGDTSVPEKPDLGYVLHRLAATAAFPGWTLRLVAVQSWPELDPHVDLAFFYEDAGGRYGGFDEQGRPVGGSAVYLSDEWLAATDAVIALDPRGRVGRAELEFLDQSPAAPPIVRLEAPPRHEH